MSVIALLGTNSLLIRRAYKKLVADHKTKNGALSVEVFDADDTARGSVIEALSSVSFFAPSKMVVLKNPSANSDISSNIENICQNCPEETILVITETKPDKRTAYYKYLKSLNGTKEYLELSVNELNSWVKDEFKALGIQIEQSAAQFLIDRLGGNQHLLLTRSTN